MTVDSLRSASGGICILQLDKVQTIAQQFGLGLEDEPRQGGALNTLLSSLIKHLSPELSGVLLDPHVGYYALPELDPSCGVAFCLDTPTIERDPLVTPPLIPHWGIEHIRNNSAVAKLELYYNPYEPEAATKKALVAELSDYARHEGIHLLLELLLYEHGEAGGHSFDELQIFAIQEFRTQCDLLALDYPQSPLAAATITAELDIPWVLTQRAEKYPQFKEELRVCMESGASGFMAGDIFWQDAKWWQSKKLDSEAAVEEVRTTTRDKAIELSRIVSEHLQGSESEQNEKESTWAD
jgi:tagatose-1,6-bisphosphate aldolase